jgi:hypothetical protein
MSEEVTLTIKDQNLRKVVDEIMLGMELTR